VEIALKDIETGAIVDGFFYNDCVNIGEENLL
jgi:hypothetical protein